MRAISFFALAVLAALLLSLFPARVVAQEPVEYAEGIPMDWGRFPEYFDVITLPRLEPMTDAGRDYRFVTFTVQEKRSLPPGKHFTARFYDAEGLEVKWSIVSLQPGGEPDVFGQWIASIGWVPDMLSVAKVKILLE